MEVKAIQGLSSSMQHSESLKRSQTNSAAKEYAQMDAPMSKNAAEAIKNNSMISFGEKKKKGHGLRNSLGAAAFVMAAPTVITGCNEYNYPCTDCGDKPNIYVICGCNDNKTDTIKSIIHDTIKGDTVVVPGDTIYVPGDTTFITRIDSVEFDKYPFAVADSIVKQMDNIGFDIHGPISMIDNNKERVALLAFAFYNKYDQTMYQGYATDDPGANTNKMKTMIIRMTDLYDRNNPKVSFMRVRATDVPGVGIQYEKSVFPADAEETADKNYRPTAFDSRFEPYESEIITNLQNGTNKVTIKKPLKDENQNYIRDAKGNVKYANEWKGEYKKGQLPQTFFLNTYARDEDGNIYIGDDGKPEYIKYDFSNAVAITKTLSDPEIYKYLGYDFE